MTRGRVGDAALTEEEVQLLERRALRLRAPADEGPVESTLEWLATFRLGGADFALPLASLRAVMPVRHVTPVPLAAPYVLGVVRYEGRLLTALSLASLLERAWRVDPFLLIVVELSEDALVAVDCGEAPQPVALAQQVVRSAGPGKGGLRPVEGPDGRRFTLIDLGGLLGSVSAGASRG